MKNIDKKILVFSCFLLVLGLISIGIGVLHSNDSKLGYYTLKIDKNGASDVEVSKLDCKIKDGGCEVTLPDASRQKGTVLGYSFNSDDIEPQYKVGDTITISSDKKIYVISYETHKMNIVTDSIDYLSNVDTSCNAYNKNDSCKIIPGAFNKKGYEVRGYSTTDKTQAGYIYPNTFVEIDDDITVYPIWNTYTRGREINVSDTFQKGSMTYDVEEGCPSSIYNTFLEYFEKIERLAPYLVIGTKVSFLTDKTFNEIWGTGYVGMNYGPTDLRMIDVRCSVGNNYYATIVHEMAHTWDFHYKSIKGNEITKQNDVINLYQDYKKKLDRPFRDYSYTDIREFFADMVRYYYLKFTDPEPEFELRTYPLDIKKVLEKYICITNNNYESSKCK